MAGVRAERRVHLPLGSLLGTRLRPVPIEIRPHVGTACWPLLRIQLVLLFEGEPLGLLFGDFALWGHVERSTAVAGVFERVPVPAPFMFLVEGKIAHEN